MCLLADLLIYTGVTMYWKQPTEAEYVRCTILSHSVFSLKDESQGKKGKY